ncbi:bifunctional hydroxymethylpyrimidine kinase/phosphomethylpyrimidine kinase [Desulfolucanica intricata]|uniref:bifunctional hydroxymethylpyrimidine kinase/phosphomethylpyrimidine kinase n=1 Tax=Desulfolucanica intricata TaxID=1285191 RepID=UPI000834F76A|nr:bifunctional hydroxymethylpyrimidine kinase/phosphomethylpyrimidine kinase [Desulfolucanica intricata]
MKKALTIAGSDSGGGAGIQADLKTFSALGVFGLTAITAVTAQNTQGVFDVQEIEPRVVSRQIDCVFEDIEIDAVKIGMVSSIEIIKSIFHSLTKQKASNIVLDPVMISKSGYKLLKQEACNELVNSLFPLATVITPNLPEAEEITGNKINTITDMEYAAQEIYALGPRAVVIKGGHLPGEPTDIFYDGERFIHIKGERFDTKNTHGTGCTYSSAITAYLAKGLDLLSAVKNAKEYITGAIKNSFSIGKGVGPTHHFYKYY